MIKCSTKQPTSVSIRVKYMGIVPRSKNTIIVI